MADRQVIEARLARVDAATAAAMLVGVDRRDPRGIARPEDVQRIARGGECFALTSPHGQCVFVINVRAGQAWINAAQGSGADDMTAIVLPAVELMASGLDSVAFQTARRGLVRKAEKLGYRVTGWILRKDM